MNILFLNSAKEWGGNEKWTVAAAAGLAARGHAVYIGCRSDIFKKHLPDCPVAIVPFPFSNHLDLFTTVKIATAIVRLHIDVVIPTKQREYLLGGLAALLFPRTAVVARLGIDRPIENWRNHFAFCRLFDGVIVNSQKIVDVLSSTPAFDTDICRVVRNGITMPMLSDAVREKVRAGFGFSESDLVIGGMGRLSPQKGFDMALDAFARVRKKAPHARFLIVGDGPDLGLLRKQSKSLGIAPAVVFAGFREDVTDILQALDLFWLTSRSEGMPNVLLEAMAAGKAALAFDVAGVPEVITDGRDGLILPFGDVAALATKTLDLIADPARSQRLEREARKTMESEFGMGRMVEATENFLMEVAAGGGRRTA